MMDLIAVVTEVQAPGQIQVKATGEMRDKRTVSLTDDTGLCLQATFWGECGQMQGLEVGNILAIKSAKVSDYGGKSLNISNDCLIEVNPDDQPRYHEIYKWYNGAGKTAKVQQLTQVGEGGLDPQSLPFVMFEEMYRNLMSDGEFLNGQQEKPKYYKCNGMIMGIPIQNGRTLFYLACVECKKKVTPDEHGAGYFCEKC